MKKKSNKDSRLVLTLVVDATQNHKVTRKTNISYK